MSSLDKIDHIVVLMLENRSFDNLLGQLYPKSPGFDGLSGAEFNLDASGKKIPVWNQPGTAESTLKIPDPDPGELWADLNTQIFGQNPPPPGGAPDMSGFVKNYIAQGETQGGPWDPRNVMHFFTPEQVPVISALAKSFAVCDRWFASAPCQTWPNRFFVHTATANGYENNSPPNFPYHMPTIYEKLDAGQVPGGWKIYFHDVPQSLTLERLAMSLDRFRYIGEFLTDARTGNLPAYSFIEPRYFADWFQLPCDMHPPHVVTLGEQLIATIYNALRGGPNWEKTLFVITFDEHGGCYDHVPPPAAAMPGPPRPGQPFAFDRYGVRVPAVLISPFIQPGTVLRPPGATPFDHTSIMATLRKRFPAIGAPLTGRDAVAPDLSSVLNLATPDNAGPKTLTALPYHTSPFEMVRARTGAPNNMQHAMIDLAKHMRSRRLAMGTGAPVSEAMQDMLAGEGLPPDLAKDVAAAVGFIKKEFAALLGGL